MIPKFRVWDKDKKWMVYDVQDAYDGLWSERNSDEINDYYSYVSTFQSFTDEERFNFMQYTGLKDRSGKEIYEGDIVTGLFNHTDIIGHIIYGSDATFFIYRKGLYGIGLNNAEDWLEVIGNIYENPELLEK